MTPPGDAWPEVYASAAAYSDPARSGPGLAGSDLLLEAELRLHTDDGRPAGGGLVEAQVGVVHDHRAGVAPVGQIVDAEIFRVPPVAAELREAGGEIGDVVSIGRLAVAVVHPDARLVLEFERGGQAAGRMP